MPGYSKTPWVEGVAPGISAANLNNLETQYEKALADLKALFDATTFLYAAVDNTPIAKTRAEVLAILSGQAGAHFSMNSKKITNLLNPTADQDADTKKARADALTSHTGVAAAHHTKTIDASELSAGLLPLARLPATLTDKDADTLDGYHAVDLIAPSLTVELFQTNAGTGTAINPQQINDNDIGTLCRFLLDDYVEVVFPASYKISEFRYWGTNSHTEDGRYKIQHWDGAAWIDNTINIPTNPAGWTDWLPLTTIVSTTKIRMVETVADTWPFNDCFELEMRG